MGLSYTHSYAVVGTENAAMNKRDKTPAQMKLTLQSYLFLNLQGPLCYNMILKYEQSQCFNNNNMHTNTYNAL